MCAAHNSDAGPKCNMATGSQAGHTKAPSRSRAKLVSQTLCGTMTPGLHRIIRNRLIAKTISDVLTGPVKRTRVCSLSLPKTDDRGIEWKWCYEPVHNTYYAVLINDTAVSLNLLLSRATTHLGHLFFIRCDGASARDGCTASPIVVRLHIGTTTGRDCA